MSANPNFQSHSREEENFDHSSSNKNEGINRHSGEGRPNVRARKVNPNPRRYYGNAVGRLGATDEDDSIASRWTDGQSAQDRDRQRKLARKRLKEKQKVPGHRQWIKWMHSEWKNHTVAAIGEFVGTTMFLFFAFGGTQVANIATSPNTGAVDPSKLLYISLSFGFSLLVNAWIFFRISGGLFNPAVTLALTLTLDLDPIRAILLFIIQICGACFAAYLVNVIFPSPFNVQTTLEAGTTVAQGVWIEALCTALLVFTIIMLAKEKHRATFIAPVGIGLSLFIAELVAVHYTGGSLNPARSFGPAAVAHNFSRHHWIYWVGPFIGAIFAVVFFQLMKILEYEMANPGQDDDPENDPTQNPEHKVAQKVQEREAEVEEIQAIEDSGPAEVPTNLPQSASTMPAKGLNEDSQAGVKRKTVGESGNRNVQMSSEGEYPDLEAQWSLSPGPSSPETRGGDYIKQR